MIYTIEFEKMVKKTLRKVNTCKNYVYRLDSMALTDGFWNNHGYTLENYLDTLQTEYKEEWMHYCKSNDIYWSARVSDWLA